MKKKAFLSFLLLIAAGLLYGFYTGNNDNMKHISAFLKNEVDKGRTPSIYYEFFDLDSTIYSAGYGFSDIKQGKKVSPAHRYPIFSVTKTFTALAVLQLAQQKKIDLHRSVSCYLPNFPYPSEITVTNLLNHTAGIPSPIPLNWIHLAQEHERFKRDSFFARIFIENQKLKSRPGTRFFYSNLGYVLLGQLIEKVSGKSYERFIQENILDALHLKPHEIGFDIDTAISTKGYHKQLSFSNLVLGFLLDKKKYIAKKEGDWKPFHPFYINGASYGGLIATPKALVTYAQSLLGSDTILLNKNSKALLFEENKIGDQSSGMSCSWFTGSLKGHHYLTHAGGGGGYYVELRIYPELGVGSVILFNRTGMKDERILDKTDAFFISDAS